MYFITTKKEGYILFSMSPSESYAIGLTEQGRVHLLNRDDKGAWAVAHQWDKEKLSHTAFMASLHRRDEPASLREWLELLPPGLR